MADKNNKVIHYKNRWHGSVIGFLFLFIFIYFRKQNPSGTKWDFCGSSSFTRAAVSCAVLMIFVFGIAVPVFDVTLRTGKPFMLEAA